MKNSGRNFKKDASGKNAGRAGKRAERLLRMALKFADSSARHRVGPYAAQASFFIIVSLVPFFMFFLSILHFLIPYLAQVSDMDIINQINAVFPDKIALALEDVVRDIFDKSSGISVITAAIALWFASRGMMAVNQGVNNVLSDGELQNYFITRAMSVVYMLAFVLLVAVTMVLYGIGSHTMQYLTSKIPFGAGIMYKLLKSRSIILFVILTLFFTLFYKFMPKRKMKIKQLIPGAAAAAVGWVLFTKGFSVYVRISKSYSSVYGGISYVVLAMLWLYFCINIMLLGAELNYALKSELFTKKA